MSISNALTLSRRTLPAFAAEGVFWAAFAAFVPELKAGIGASDAEFGVVLLFSALGAVTAMWLAPWFDARAGRYALALAALLLAVSFQLPMQVSGLWAFTGLMVLVGAASGLLDVVMNARLSAIESHERVSLMNLNHAIFSFAYAGSAVATGLARQAGVAPGFVFAALFGLVGLASFFMVQPAEPARDPRSAPAPEGRLPRAVFWGGMIIFAGFLAENATEGWSALHIERTLGGGAAEGALGPAMLGLTMGVGRLAGQFVVAHLSEARVVFWAALVSAAGSLIAALAWVPVMAYAGFAILGLGVSVVAPMVFALIGRNVPDGLRARSISRAAIVGYFGFFVGPPMMGFVAEAYGLRLSFVFVAAVLGVVPLFLWQLRQSARVN